MEIITHDQDDEYTTEMRDLILAWMEVILEKYARNTEDGGDVQSGSPDHVERGSEPRPPERTFNG